MTISLLYTGTPRELVIQEWKELGFEVLVQPLFSYQVVEFTIPDLTEIEFCIISSQRTVPILEKYLPKMIQKGLDFYVVGTKTAELLREQEIPIEEIGERGFLSLQERLPKGQKGIFWGAKELAEPSSEYIEQNHLVKHVPVYQQIQSNISVQKQPDGIIATSPKGIDIIGKNEAWRRLPLFVLGGTSEKKAKETGFSIVLKCSHPQLENITEILLQYFQNEQRN